MRRALETLVTGILRSRLGIALMLAVLILGVVGAARLVSGVSGNDSGLSGAPVEPIATVDPTTGDDGVITTEPPPTPRTSPGAAAPEEIAGRFAAAWLAHEGVSAKQWHDKLRPLSTSGLADRLSGVDPAGVPAERLTGKLEVVTRSAELVEVSVPVDAGTLRLELVAPQGRWLVDAVDWERG
ncbi:hypothetical protein BDK92_3966 [Micromonospora pisi]|uniref:Mce-associated membrane protein n=1 Tax=Micromonospora pisi TaxID=589240 RepID=A0A495JL87_9ACTN|nr:hypothetical protein [Micromonospora pisi]RKR89611.1 hypothetical protein BDK92_3966 [Micromonospora pisi]